MSLGKRTPGMLVYMLFCLRKHEEKCDSRVSISCHFLSSHRRAFSGDMTTYLRVPYLCYFPSERQVNLIKLSLWISSSFRRQPLTSFTWSVWEVNDFFFPRKRNALKFSFHFIHFNLPISQFTRLCILQVNWNGDIGTAGKYVSEENCDSSKCSTNNILLQQSAQVSRTTGRLLKVNGSVLKVSRV